MKYSGLITFVILFLLSCRTNDKKADKATHALIEKFKPYLHGIWIPKEYVDDLEKTKSPFRSSDKIPYISEFSIDTTGVLDNSTHISAGFGNHEGGDFILYFKQGRIPTTLLTSLSSDDREALSYQLGFITRKEVALLVLYKFGKNKGVETTEYVKAETIKTGELGDAFQYMVNKKLMAGTYDVFDPAGNKTKVELTTDGKTIGLDDFKTYYILTDFVASPENITDEVCFEPQTKDQKCYGFETIADTINLFEPVKNELDTLFKPGATIYKFIKQK